jgi:hypothetical protein
MSGRIVNLKRRNNMKSLLMNILLNFLLGGAIILLIIALDEGSFIYGCIGGAFVGIYNAIVYKED